MRRLAGVLSLIVAIVCLGTAVTSCIDDVNSSPDRIQEGFNHINRRDYDALDKSIDREAAARRFMGMEAICGATFLIVGLTLVAKRSLQPATQGS